MPDQPNPGIGKTKSMNEVMSPLAESFLEQINAGLSDDCMKRIKKQVEDMLYEIETDLDWRMKNDMQSNLASYVQDMAEKAVDALLRGDVGQMGHYLRCAPGYYNGRESHPTLGPVIHGKLSEHDPLLLRKQIVDAHADLLKNERILDLEAQVMSLVDQVNSLERQNSRLGERLRELS